MADLPADLLFTTDHEWVRVTGTVARVGVTEHATTALGDIVYVSLPTVGSHVSPGDSCAELESTKSVSGVYAPAAGVIASVNEPVVDAPETIGADPYGDGWLFDIEMEGQLAESLLDADAYGVLLTESGG